MAKKRGPDTFISRLFTRHRDLRKIEGRRAREMARTMKDVKKKALGLIERNMTTFREAGEYIDSASAVARAEQTVAGIDALMSQRADWATSNVLSMRQDAWRQGVSDIQFASQRLPTGIQASMEGSFGQVFPEAAFSAIEHPVLGVAPDAMFNGVRAGTTQNMRDVLVNAVMNGESVQATGRRLSDAMDLSVAAGERIARTNVNAAYNEAQRSVYDANSDIIAGYAWEATLDDRTSQVCFMLHGQFWPLGSKTPGPPAHWNCRSILIPVFKDPAIQSLLDETPRRARNYNKQGVPTDTFVRSSTTPEQWARRQPTEVTRSITGSELKNSLFRRKLIGFDDLVDPSLRVRTDQEIIRRAAGLHPTNKALAKKARAMGVKRIPSQQAIASADASLAKKQPWRVPEPPPGMVETKEAFREMTYSEWVDSLTKKEKDVFRSWRGSGYKGIRKALAGQDVSDEVRDAARTFEDALARAPKHKGTVYRGMTSIPESDFRSLMTSDSFSLQTPVSSSRKRDVALDFVYSTDNNALLIIKGQTRGTLLNIPKLDMIGEGEVILPKGAKYRILSRKWKWGRVGDIKKYLELIVEEIL